MRSVSLITALEGSEGIEICVTVQKGYYYSLTEWVILDKPFHRIFKQKVKVLRSDVEFT